jgi:hypothetical protein
MPIYARRVFRLSITTALSLAVAYGTGLPLPFLAPIFALMLASQPSPPLHLKGLIGLVVLVSITLGIGLMIIPLLTYYSSAGILIIALGLYFCGHLLVNLGKDLVGTFLAIGFTIIPAAGTVDISLAVAVIQALITGIGIAVLCQWVIYPWLPEDDNVTKAKKTTNNSVRSNWIAMRFTLIVLPPFMLSLVNPAMFLKLIMKSVVLGKQSSEVSAKDAGRELLGSTFLGGFFTILFWLLRKINPTLIMFFSWMLIFGIYFSCKIYRVLETRYPPSFWLNVAVTMLILLGSAVQDSANGEDVYHQFTVRMGMFVLLTLYAWAAIYLLDLLYKNMKSRSSRIAQSMEISNAS